MNVYINIEKAKEDTGKAVEAFMILQEKIEELKALGFDVKIEIEETGKFLADCLNNAA